MKITYSPTGINNFHNSNPINLVVSGEKTRDYSDREVYRISKRQAQRAMNHFCGITDCRCPHGAVVGLDQDDHEFGLPIKYC
jgi:hypothetical protein